MSSRRIHLEKLVGKVVVDSTGQKVGRLEEIIVNGEGLVEEYVLGREGLWERLGIVGLSLIFLGKKRKGKRVPWEKMELGRMRLSCSLQELDETTAP